MEVSTSALLALGAVAVVGATVIANGRGDAPVLDPTRVLVDIFQNETGDPSLDHLGRMATDRVTAGLTVTSFVDVVSLGTRLLSRAPVVSDTGLLEQADLQALARANGTGTVVSGSYYLAGDSVHFLAHVTDAGTGEELAALEPVWAAVGTPASAIKAGQAALGANRPREAIEFLTQADPESGWLRGWSFYWGVLARAHHILGEHREELAVARRARRLFPNFWELELRALAALGRTDEVQVLLEEDGSWTWDAASEFLLHDHLDAASQVLDRGIMRGQARLTTAPTDTTSRQIGYDILVLADMLLLHSRVDEARVLLERAIEERADSPFRREYVGTLGVIAGMQGDRRRALEIGQHLAAQPWNWLADLALWQSRIAASLGELDRATALLRDAVGKGRLGHIHLRHPLLWQALRDYPPFQELTRPKG